jgi:hypothetical protein
MTPLKAFYKCRNNKQRDKDLELIIIKDPMYAYGYAKDVIKGRWIEAEQYVINNSEVAYYYAKHKNQIL